MTRVANANDFTRKFRSAVDAYSTRFGPAVAEVRRQLDEKKRAPEGPSLAQLIEENLEAHIRAYVVNAFLAALNWGLDDECRNLPSLVPEAPVRSLATGATRFLDYLGFDLVAGFRPLLLVETKRPNSSLGGLGSDPAGALAQQVRTRKWVGQCGEWLSDVADYVASVERNHSGALRRVLVTNGDWFVIFLDPRVLVDPSTGCSRDQVLVFRDVNEVALQAGSAFQALEHQHVLGEVGDLNAGELPFAVDPSRLSEAMHGLRIAYIQQRGVCAVAPVLRVAPVIFLRSSEGAWMRVASPPRDWQLPRDRTRLDAHLNDIDREAGALLQLVCDKIGKSLKLRTIIEHYSDAPNGALLLRGVTQESSASTGFGFSQYLVATGAMTHFIAVRPAVSDCPFHDWKNSHDHGHAHPEHPVMRPSVEPRSFFCSGDLHHCSRSDVYASKASPITAANSSNCGPRSGGQHSAFCEVWDLEAHLCCRTCVFEEACTKAVVFRLPCRVARDATTSSDSA